MKKIFVTGMMICLAGGMFGCSSASNMTTLTRGQIEAKALELKPEEFRKDNFYEAMSMVNTDYTKNMDLEEAGQRLMEAADQLTYLPKKAYNLLRENGVAIYIAEDLGVCYSEIMDVETEGNEEELYGGMYTSDIDDNPFIFMSADDVGSSLYHEIGHAVDDLSNTDESLSYCSDSKEFINIYEKERMGSKWKDMDNFEYYTHSTTEFFAEAFQNYCDSIYFNGAMDELYSSIPSTMKFIDSMVK